MSRLVCIAQALLPIAQEGLGPLNDWVVGQFAASDNVLWTALLLMAGGLLASLLPCVYPLYPITASIVRARAAGGAAWPHPVAYYFGLCLTYAILGTVAVTTGGGLNTILRYGVTNLVIAFFLVILALSTFGFLHLAIFRPREVAKAGGLCGTFLLGASAGLLSSACVGPVVVSVLLNLATIHGSNFSWYTLGSGAAQMFAFGMGVGLPFLAVGLLGMRLPKSGNWLLGVQYALGAVVLWFAYAYLQKGLDTYGFRPDAGPVVGFALVGLFACAYLYHSSLDDIQTRTLRSLTVVGFVVSAAILFRQFQPTGPGLATAKNPTANEEASVEVDGELSWYLNDEDAYRRARERGRPVFIDFYGSWCTNCKEFSRLSRDDKPLRSALRHPVLLKVYDTSPVFQKFLKDPRFPELRVGLPFFVITDADGNLLYKTNDYLKTDEMILFLSP